MKKTRAELLAELHAGKISTTEYLAQLHKLPGIRFGMEARHVEIFAVDSDVDEKARTITGTITVFGVESSDGRVIEPGAISEVREPYDRVKLLVDHDQTQSVGYMTELSLGTDLARATFHVPETPEGDDALNRAKLRLRNGLSIGAAAKRGGYFWDDEDVIHYTALELYETSLCAIPAFQNAQVEEVAARLAHNRKETNRMDREQIEAAYAAGKITEAQRDAAIATLAAFADAPPAPSAPPAQLGVQQGLPSGIPAEFAAGPSGSVAPIGRTEDRPTSFREVAAGVVEFARNRDLGGLVQYVNAELGKIGVTSVEDGDFNPFLRPQWLGEIWNAAPEGRPWIDSLGGVKPLTSDRIEGFRWARPDEYTGVAPDKEARPEIYPGNFAEVPTGTRKLIKVSDEPDQWGVGVKVDRIFTDLGSEDLVASLFAVFSRDYDLDSDAHVRDEILAAATEPVDELDNPIVDATVVGALTGAAMSLKQINGRLNRIWIAPDVFTDFSALTVAQLPAWLANQLGFVDLSDGSASVSSALKMDVDFSLPSGTMLGYDSRAATVFEKADIRLQAIDVAHRATDIGWFGYGGVLVNDARAIVRRTLS